MTRAFRSIFFVAALYAALQCIAIAWAIPALMEVVR